ncbi:glycerol-3-phosphate 1-O-acyltransferase PlsY [candidate division KSB1 bacterium]
MSIITIILVSYIIGSIPTSIIVSKLWKGIDIRQYGSGNAGLTNVLRVLGWKPSIIVGIVDFSKAYIATVYFSKIGADSIPLDYTLIQIIAGLSAVLGHIWTIFAGFKGGKGVLTALGLIVGLDPFAALICFIIFWAIVYLSRYVSLGSICAAVFFPIVILIEKQYFNKDMSNYLLIFSLFICILIIYTHRSNIKRLLAGTENKFGKKKKQ